MRILQSNCERDITSYKFMQILHKIIFVLCNSTHDFLFMAVENTFSIVTQEIHIDEHSDLEVINKVEGDHEVAE